MVRLQRPLSVDCEMSTAQFTLIFELLLQPC